MPYGYPRSVTTSYPFCQIVQAVGVIVILNDRPHVYRHIPTDTKAHLDDIFPPTRETQLPSGKATRSW